MAPLCVTPAGERIDRTRFHPGEEGPERRFHFGWFVCSHCGHPLRFKASDFQRHMFRGTSALPPELTNAMDEERPLRGDLSEFAVDFECPGCKRPTRLVIEPWEYAMGGYAFTVHAVVEGRESGRAS